MFRELSLGRQLVAGAKIALLEETLDLLDDALIEAAAADRLDDGQGLTSPKSLWSGGQTRCKGAAYGGLKWSSTVPSALALLHVRHAVGGGRRGAADHAGKDDDRHEIRKGREPVARN